MKPPGSTRRKADSSVMEEVGNDNGETGDGGLAIAAMSAFAGAAAGAAIQYRMLVSEADPQTAGVLGYRMYLAALVHLEKEEEALELLRSLIPTPLRYLALAYKDPATLPHDLARTVSVLRAYHEKYSLPGLEPRSRAWLEGIPLAALPSGCPSPLVELLASEPSSQ